VKLVVGQRENWEERRRELQKILQIRKDGGAEATVNFS
jgi:hypothetical protein